jgi:cytochrome c biogenesis protein CcmG/thiol:disulfide interchange protein DsbE
MKRNIWIAAVVVMMAGFAIYQNIDKEKPAAAESAVAKPKDGYAAPEFKLPDLKDQTVQVGGAKDKLTFINFWASWCGPCELEMPDLQQLHDKYGDRLDVYGVNATNYDRERQARSFVDEHELTFPILMDRDGEVVALYKVAQFPTSLLIDQNGIVRKRVTGVIPKEQWIMAIEAILQEKAGS